jgi:hypothetical protein
MFKLTEFIEIICISNPEKNMEFRQVSSENENDDLSR